MVRYTRSSLIMGDGPSGGREGRALACPPVRRPSRPLRPTRRAEERPWPARRHRERASRLARTA